MKKLFFSVILMTVIVGIFIVGACQSSPSGARKASFKPGTYHVEGMGHNGIVPVSVTFTRDRIYDIVIGDNDESRYLGTKAMEIVRADILNRQSLNVDKVAGATISGRVLQYLVSQAVIAAGGNPDLLNSPPPKDDTKYKDETVDLVVVGGGGTGLAATVEASLLGLNVIMIEQLGILGGSSGRAGHFYGGGTRLQVAQGIDLDPERYVLTRIPRNQADVDYPTPLEVRSRGRYNPAWEQDPLYNWQAAYNLGKMLTESINWAQDIGVQFGPVQKLEQHPGPKAERLGGFLVEGYQKKLDELKVDYRLNTKGIELIMKDGKCIGIKVTGPNGSEYNIFGNVLLATGGFLANQEMVAQYYPPFAGLPTDQTSGADGSGLRMAQAVGAQLINMAEISSHPLATYWNGASRSLSLPAGNGAIAVNKAGKRFANESNTYSVVAAACLEQGEVWCVFDHALTQIDNFSEDKGLSNVMELYQKADTPEELAVKLGIDPEGLATTIKRYSSFVINQKDDEDTGKSIVTMRSALITPPYYGVKTNIETHISSGGIKVDHEFRPLDANNKPILGLYAAGEATVLPLPSRSLPPFSMTTVGGRFVAQLVAKNK